MKIVFNTNTGTTKKYAEALAAKLDCEAVPFAKAGEVSDEVIFMSWVQMGEIQLLPEARERFSIKAVAAVGVMSLDEKSKAEVIEKNAVTEQFFLLPGVFSVDRLSGMYKMLMKMGLSMMKQKAKASGNPDDMKAFAVFEKGIDLYDESALDAVVNALKGGGENE